MNDNQIQTLSNLDKRSELKSDLIKQLESEGNENTEEVAENIINTYEYIENEVFKSFEYLGRTIGEVGKAIVPILNKFIETLMPTPQIIVNVYDITLIEEIEKHLNGREYAIYKKTKKKRTKVKYFNIGLQRMLEDNK